MARALATLLGLAALDVGVATFGLGRIPSSVSAARTGAREDLGPWDGRHLAAAEIEDRFAVTARYS
jgi:hypothetical protein